MICSKKLAIESLLDLKREKGVDFGDPEIYSRPKPRDCSRKLAIENVCWT